MADSGTGKLEWLGALRQWRYRRQGLGKEFVAGTHILVDSLDQQILASDWLQSALYFSAGRPQIEIMASGKIREAPSIQDAINALSDHGPARYLFIGDAIPAVVKRALDFLKIPYTVLAPPNGRLEKLDRFETPHLPRHYDKINRRFSIYAHLIDEAYLPKIIDAFHEARLTFPDLILLVPIAFENTLYDLGQQVIARCDDPKEVINAADILLTLEDDNPQDWYAVANTVLFAGRFPNVGKLALNAVRSGATVVLYDNNSTRNMKLREMQSSGNLWSVRRDGLLSATLVQSLEPEKAALAAVQSQNILLDDDGFYQELDAFLALERA